MYDVVDPGYLVPTQANSAGLSLSNENYTGEALYANVNEYQQPKEPKALALRLPTLDSRRPSMPDTTPLPSSTRSGSRFPKILRRKQKKGGGGNTTIAERTMGATPVNSAGLPRGAVSRDNATQTCGTSFAPTQLLYSRREGRAALIFATLLSLALSAILIFSLIRLY